MTDVVTDQEDSSPVVVLVDANILIQSPRLSSAAWRAALRAHDAGTLALRVPEICVIEAGAWLRRTLPKRMRDFRRAVTDLENVGVRLNHDPWSDDAFDLDRLAFQAEQGYETYLRQRVGVDAVLPMPSVDHIELVRRAVNRVRPFNEAGAGYRDALIWEVVCIQAAQHPVIFVTNNTRDFAEEGRLASDLEQDLVARNLDADIVTLATSLLDVVRAHAPEATDARRVAEQFLSSANSRRQLEEELAAAFAQYEGIPYPALPGELADLLDDPIVQAVWNLEDVVVTDVKPDGDSSYLIVGTARAMGEAYSRHDDVRAAEIAAAEAARRTQAIDEFFEDGADLVVLKHLPVIVEFAATFEPNGYVWNAGVTDIRRADAP